MEVWDADPPWKDAAWENDSGAPPYVGQDFRSTLGGGPRVAGQTALLDPAGGTGRGQAPCGHPLVETLTGLKVDTAGIHTMASGISTS